RERDPAAPPQPDAPRRVAGIEPGLVDYQATPLVSPRLAVEARRGDLSLDVDRAGGEGDEVAGLDAELAVVAPRRRQFDELQVADGLKIRLAPGLAEEVLGIPGIQRDLLLQVSPGRLAGQEEVDHQARELL